MRKLGLVNFRKDFWEPFWDCYQGLVSLAAVFLDVTQRSPSFGSALRDIQKTATRETNQGWAMADRHVPSNDESNI